MRHCIIWLLAVHHRQRGKSHMDWRDGQQDDSNSAGMSFKQQDWNGKGKLLRGVLFSSIWIHLNAQNLK
jgi:hypothetical protein